MFVRIFLILVVVLAAVPLRAQLTQKDITDLTRFYMFRASATTSSQILEIDCSGDDSELSPTLARRMSSVWIDTGISYAMYEIGHVQVWWPGLDDDKVQLPDRDEVTSVVLANFVGDARWVGLLVKTTRDHPVVRNRNLFATASALCGYEELALQDIVAGNAALQQLHDTFPTLPKPLGLYVDYRDIGTASMYE